MSSLLKITKLPKEQRPKTGSPGYMEFRVTPETAPYLVTSSKGSFWIPAPSEDGVVRAALREDCAPEQFFVEVVESVHEAGTHLEWGNVLPMTPRGLREAIDYVLSYGMGEYEILVRPEGAGAVLCSETETPTRPTSWMPEDLIVVAPKDRRFVGDVWKVGPQVIVGLVHNAARGLALVSARVEGQDGAA